MEVVSASHGVFGPLLGKLTALLAKECGRLKGVRREIRALRSELASMHAALREYTKLEEPDDQVKTWISLVRELAYDTEDVFDKFINRLGNGQDDGGFKEFFRKTARRLKTLGARRGIAGQIDDLKVRINQVKELKDCYKLNDAPSSTTGHATVDPRLHALFSEEARLVGIDGPRDDLANWMVEGNNSSEHLKVLSIVGFGGLGKTTVAKEVRQKIGGHFDCRAFVSVSQKPDIKKIIKDVISQVSIQDGCTDNWDERKSIAKLRELLQDKRYLVIIDDIWSTLAWEAVKCAFPENNHSSRIIVTTRDVQVARSCCQSGDDRIYQMKGLSKLDSKRLFSKRIFGSEDCCPGVLNEVSNEILKKCGGLPLAIISISGLLANIPAVKEEWVKIKRSIGSALQNNQSLEGMSSILLLGYNHLPPNLKTCLLYLSAFPEDFVIKRCELVRQWIAEGFIPEERGQSQQDVAEHYFYELINKSMVQPWDIEPDGKVRACRVHDMILEILISKSCEDNFITVVGSGQAHLSNHHSVIRRLSIQHIDQNLASKLAKEDLTHVRSLIITAQSGGIEHLPSLVKFEALRILDFAFHHDLQEYIMKGLDKLSKLKYLKLMGRGTTKLPPGIVRLHDLQTLDLQGTNVKELPDGFVQMTELQHLLTEGFAKMPNGIGGMMNLWEISSFDITRSPANAVDFGNLANLNTLSVKLDSGLSEEHRRREEMFLSSMCKLGNCKLQHLTIDRFGGSLEFLDSWSPLPSSLQTCLTKLTVEGLHTLGELPALLILHLQIKTGPGDRIIVQHNCFPSLNEFTTSAKKGANFIFMKGAMPKLEILGMSINLSVGKTYGFYTGMENLGCLRELRLTLPCKDGTPFDDTPAAAVIRKEAVAAFAREAASHANHPSGFLTDETGMMTFLE
nr:disease resistance protein RGA5-like isoform X2 [Lolium perenne]